MASLISKLTQLARTPKGREFTQKAAAKAKEYADKPETRRKVEDLRRRVVDRGQRGGGGR